MPPTRSASSFFVALLLVLVAALSVAASARATGQLARGGARVQGYYLEDELRPLRSSRKLLQDAVPEAPAPVDEQVEDQESTPSSTTLEDAAEAVGDPGGVNEADEDGLSSDEPTTDQSQDTSPVTVVQESFSAPAPTGNDNKVEEEDSAATTTAPADSLSGLATSIADDVNSASSSEEGQEEGSAPSSTASTTDSLSGLTTFTANEVISAQSLPSISLPPIIEEFERLRPPPPPRSAPLATSFTAARPSSTPNQGRTSSRRFGGGGGTDGLERRVEYLEYDKPTFDKLPPTPLTTSFTAARPSSTPNQGGRTSSRRFGEGGGTDNLERSEAAAAAATARQGLVDDFTSSLSELACVGAEANATEPCEEEDPIDIIRGRISGIRRCGCP